MHLNKRCISERGTFIELCARHINTCIRIIVFEIVMMSRHIRQYENAALLPSAYFAIIAYIGFFLKAMVRSPFTFLGLGWSKHFCVLKAFASWIKKKKKKTF